MAIQIALHHRTTYRYNRPVTLGPQTVRLKPAPHCRTPVLSYSLKISPSDHFINWQQDPQGNYLARLVFPAPTRELSVEVDLVAELATFNPFDFFLEPGADKIPFPYEKSLAIELAPYLRQDAPSPAFATFLEGIDLTPQATIEFLVNLNLRVNQAVKYVIRLEPGVQTPEETLTLGSGSCRDSAYLLLQTFRHIGLAARFVSGYLIQLRADVKPLGDGAAGATQDFADLHAWCEVYLPGAGWIGLDPTSGLFAGEGHLPLACSPEPSSAAPISGIVEKCETAFDFAMTVRRLSETPRVTLPYSDESWAEIDALGTAIDQSLQAGDVRLTMGGEPTFVAMDDMDGPEWNTLALGPRKRELGGKLFQRLVAQYGKGGFIHHGQGKWYPGEPLPRWVLTCVWRRDGLPLWREPRLLADPEVPGTRTAADARRFIEALAQRLGIGADRLVPGFEDAFYHAWKERRVPASVDLKTMSLFDQAERARLARVLESGLDKPAGYALPILCDPVGRWLSAPWAFVAGAMFLIPGDSPMGLRLPLALQPWRPPGTPPKKEVEGEVRFALCVEVRAGHVYVFLPPCDRLDDYLALLVAVEATAASLQLPLVLEGYLPPFDPKLDNLKVTPDPGVVEINIHPSSSWRSLSQRTEWLYAAARECGLGASKFMIDGRHAGTGGGNHIVLGGAKPEDSPLLRRPHLLQSLVAYWHQHPSLSYLFSGLFVGPTSQAPRVDEARNDSIYELEIAFRELESKLATSGPDGCPPWLVDRIFRNLLIDVTGNTHRAEFCIDKLYSPDSATGRLGLLELRGFEMPPHPKMSLVQQLLIRGLIARFWEHPYSPRRLERWGTDLHDRFMLPHYLQADFGDVISDLQNWGMPFAESWFAPHFEFRFPYLGRVRVREIEIELRQALEPWHVMGEESTEGGTVRLVDSSVERLQIKVTGLTSDRYVLACNGVAIPLHPTGLAGEHVAGVRYRAWKAPSSLHPTIEVDSPLVFDLIDSWNQKALGGCTYHVTHPGGRNYTTLPVNSSEAESRRLARFFASGHNPGPIPAPRPRGGSPEFRYTLDLRDASLGEAPKKSE